MCDAKRFFAVLAIFAILVFATSLFLRVEVAASSEVHVLPSESIQEAINDAVDGDTIVIQNGIHVEGEYPIVVNKSITLKGQDAAESIVDGIGTFRGILLVKASGARIVNLTVQNTTENFGVCGISLANVGFVEVADCRIRGCGSGVGLTNASENNLTRNNIENNKSFGVYLHSSSSFNRVFGNNLTGNPTGLVIADTSCQSNEFYHNNFVGNTNQQSNVGMSNHWDNGYPSGGNYWSDHSNIDEANGVGQNVTGSDGIVDVNYQDLDEYPLSAPVSFFFLCRSGQRDYYARAASNFTVSGFQFMPNNASVALNVSGDSGGHGFCRVSLPKDVVWVESGEFWTILVNETSPLNDALIMDDVDSTYFYAGFEGGTQNLRIAGAHAVSEFSWLALVVFVLCLISLVNFVEKSCLRKLAKQFAKG